MKVCSASHWGYAIGTKAVRDNRFQPCPGSVERWNLPCGNIKFIYSQAKVSDSIMTLQCWNKMTLSQKIYNKIYNVILHSLPAGQKNYNDKTVEEDPPLPTDTFEQPPLPKGPPPEVSRKKK